MNKNILNIKNLKNIEVDMVHRQTILESKPYENECSHFKIYSFQDNKIQTFIFPNKSFFKYYVEI